MLQGLRIDYVLVTSDLLPKMGTCQVVDTPPKWSDHAALLAEVNDVDPPPLHEPLPTSSRRSKRFDQRSQRSIAMMFAKKQSNASNLEARPQEPCEATADSSAATNGVAKADGKAVEREETLLEADRAKEVKEETRNSKRQRTDRQASEPGIEREREEAASKCELTSNRVELVEQKGRQLSAGAKPTGDTSAAKVSKVGAKKKEGPTREKGQTVIASFFSKATTR